MATNMTYSEKETIRELNRQNLSLMDIAAKTGRSLSSVKRVLRDTRTNTAMGMSWGDKGCVRDTSRCEHEDNDGCEYCCMTCNVDGHRCPNCGTVSDHRETTCGPTLSDCYKR